MNDMPPVPEFLRRAIEVQEEDCTPDAPLPGAIEWREDPICACEAIFTGYHKRQTKGGNKIEVKFLVNPVDVHDKLATMDLGEIVKLYVTKPKEG